MTTTSHLNIHVMLRTDLNVLIVRMENHQMQDLLLTICLTRSSTAFAVEIALAVARKDTSAIRIKNRQDLLSRPMPQYLRLYEFKLS